MYGKPKQKGNKVMAIGVGPDGRPIELEEVIPTPKSTTGVRIRPRRTQQPKQTITVMGYDLEEDYEVPHSGTVDPETGQPKYDECPTPGNQIMMRQIPGTNVRPRYEPVNTKGQRVDESGAVINPKQYEDEEKDSESLNQL